MSIAWTSTQASRYCWCGKPKRPGSETCKGCNNVVVDTEKLSSEQKAWLARQLQKRKSK